MYTFGLGWVVLFGVLLISLYLKGVLLTDTGFAVMGVGLGVPVLVVLVALVSRMGTARTAAVAHVSAAKAASAPSGPSMTDRFGGWLQSNALPVGGVLLGIGAFALAWAASYQEDPKPLLALAVALLVASVACFLAAANKLGDTVRAWVKHGLPATGLLFSLVALTWIGHSGERNGYDWYKMPEVWAAAFVAFQFALATVGLFGAFWGMVGNIIAGALTGKIGGPILAGILWIALIGVAAFIANYTGKFEIFEDFEDAAKLGELASIGLFIAMFVGIVFGIPGIILWTSRNKKK